MEISSRPVQQDKLLDYPLHTPVCEQVINSASILCPDPQAIVTDTFSLAATSNTVCKLSLGLDRQSPSKDSQPQPPQGCANTSILESSSMVPSASVYVNQVLP